MIKNLLIMFILYSINKYYKSLHYFITFSKINLTVITPPFLLKCNELGSKVFDPGIMY